MYFYASQKLEKRLFLMFIVQKYFFRTAHAQGRKGRAGLAGAPFVDLPDLQLRHVHGRPLHAEGADRKSVV